MPVLSPAYLKGRRLGRGDLEQHTLLETSPGPSMGSLIAECGSRSLAGTAHDPTAPTTFSGADGLGIVSAGAGSWKTTGARAIWRSRPRDRRWGRLLPDLSGSPPLPAWCAISDVDRWPVAVDQVRRSVWRIENGCKRPFCEFLRAAVRSAVSRCRMFGKTGVFCDGLMLGMVRTTRSTSGLMTTIGRPQSFRPSIREKGRHHRPAFGARRSAVRRTR
jgi:hypothetical protein